MSDDLASSFRGPDFRPADTEGGIGKPKRKSRKRASAQRWEEIRAKKLGPCLVCQWLGETQQHSSSLHHVVAKSLGGSDCESNVVSLCGDGVQGHHGLVERHDAETCRVFADAIQNLDGHAYSYAVQHLGEDGFARRYIKRWERAV